MNTKMESTGKVWQLSSKSKSYQITIKKDIVQALGIEKGDIITVDIINIIKKKDIKTPKTKEEEYNEKEEEFKKNPVAKMAGEVYKKVYEFEKEKKEEEQKTNKIKRTEF